MSYCDFYKVGSINIWTETQFLYFVYTTTVALKLSSQDVQAIKRRRSVLIQGV